MRSLGRLGGRGGGREGGVVVGAAAEKLIVDQVAQGKIFAAVDEVTGMVHFSEDKPDEEFG